MRIKNWERFQHYKDRNPPWIKLHYEILTSRDWVMLDDASKLLAVVCMLLASRENNGLIPDDADYIRRVAHLDKMPDFRPLIKVGFLIAQDDASKCLQTLANACAIDRDRGRDRDRGEAETDGCSETVAAAPARSRRAAPPDTSPIVMTFPTDGNPRTFDLRESLASKLTEAYPHLDATAEFRKAKLWLETNPDRTKTARGMPAFLTRWFERAQNSTGGNQHGRNGNNRADHHGDGRVPGRLYTPADITGPEEWGAGGAGHEPEPDLAMASDRSG